MAPDRDTPSPPPSTQARVQAGNEPGLGEQATAAAAPVVEAIDDDDTYTEKIGLVIDERYRITGLVGRGGMGSVYKAEHVGIGRTVALKLLHPALAGISEISKRFEREALAVGRIEHPNCVDVSDFGKLDDGSLYLVTEYLEGKSVGDILAVHRRIAPLRALHIMRHMLRGLSHAHAADIIHRDMKPENIIIVEQDGDPDFAKILDFGIAKMIGTGSDTDSVRLTQAGVAFGTPIYMSPEQAVGNPVDARADLYGATVVLFEMITGRPPFYSDDKLEVLSMHTTREVPLFAEIAADLAVPPDIESLVRCGLAKRPDDRFDSAAAYVDAIDAILGEYGSGGEVTRTSRPSPGRLATAPVVYDTATPLAGARVAPVNVETIPVEQARRGRKRLVLATAAITAVTVITVILILFAVGGDDAPDARTPSAEAISLTDRAAAKLESGNPKAAVDLLEDNPDEISDDARAQLQLGHGYSALARSHDSIRAYERALTLEPNLAEDDAQAVHANLLVMLKGKNGEVALDAADIMLTKLNDHDADDHLVKMASTYRTMVVRVRARELAQKHGLLERVDLVASYGRDLVQANGCAERRKVVASLRALDDKAAIPALKKARYRAGQGKWKGKNINVCLVDDAKAAISYLESLKKPK
jgi:hypothetical protein